MQKMDLKTENSSLFRKGAKYFIFSVILLLVFCVFQTSVSQADRRQHIPYPGIADKDNISWFVHITDIHIGKNSSAIPNLEWVRDTAYPAIEPDFVVATGDLTESEGTWYYPPCCFHQSEEEWNDYFNLINFIGFRENFYDMPGNHDRYGDPEWDGDTGNDGYTYRSVRGVSSNPRGQFLWSYYGNYFIAANTCDETGESIPWTLGRSDTPQLSALELDDLEARLTQFYTDPNGELVFLFGHHSIFTRPGHSQPYLNWIPGLYDPDIDEENLNARGAEDFIGLLNMYEVSAYVFGHTHENQVFIDQNVAGFDDVSAIQVNTGSLVYDDGGIDTEFYRIIAIDNHGVSTTTTTIGGWPVIVITSPVHKYIWGGSNQSNPYYHPIPKSHTNPIRSLGFGNTEYLEYMVDGNGYNSDWNDMEAVDGVDHLYQGIWDSSSWPSGTYTISVREKDQSSEQTIEIDLVDSPTTFTVNDPNPTAGSCISASGENFASNNTIRFLLDGKVPLSTIPSEVTSSETGYLQEGTFCISLPDSLAPGYHYIGAFDEEGNYSDDLVEAYEPGDINGDGWITILDLQLLIDCLLEWGSCERCDLNDDGWYTILDLQLLIDILLGL